MENEHIIFSNDKVSVCVSGSVMPEGISAQKSKVVELHFHEEYEFLYCQRGALECTVEGACYVLNRGDVIFINGLVPHTTRSYADTAYLMVQFRSPYATSGALSYLNRFTALTDNLFRVFKKGSKEAEDIQKCMTAMVCEEQDKKIAYEYYMLANMHMIMAVLYRSGTVTDDINTVDMQSIKKVMPALDFVCNNFERPISVSDGAEVLRIDKAYFCRLFKNKCNCTFTEYLNFVRVCKAEELLKNGESISQTAYNVGFSSQSYFDKIFKKYKLCSPREYKVMYKGKI